jgi:hypothetical protein
MLTQRNTLRVRKNNKQSEKLLLGLNKPSNQHKYNRHSSSPRTMSCLRYCSHLSYKGYFYVARIRSRN